MFLFVTLFFVTARNFLSKEELSCQKKKISCKQEEVACQKEFIVTKINFLSPKGILSTRLNFTAGTKKSCFLKRLPQIQWKILSKEDISCHRKDISIKQKGKDLLRQCNEITMIKEHYFDDEYQQLLLFWSKWSNRNPLSIGQNNYLKPEITPNGKFYPTVVVVV